MKNISLKESLFLFFKKIQNKNKYEYGVICENDTVRISRKHKITQSVQVRLVEPSKSQLGHWHTLDNDIAEKFVCMHEYLQQNGSNDVIAM